MTIVSDATTWSVTSERHSDNPRGVIYDRNIFITQAPGSKKNGKKPFVLVALKQRSPKTRVTRSLKKNCPIFRNVAKTIAKLQKHKLKVKNSCIKMLLNVKISTTNCVLKLLI